MKILRINKKPYQGNDIEECVSIICRETYGRKSKKRVEEVTQKLLSSSNFKVNGADVEVAGLYLDHGKKFAITDSKWKIVAEIDSKEELDAVLMSLELGMTASFAVSMSLELDTTTSFSLYLWEEHLNPSYLSNLEYYLKLHKKALSLGVEIDGYTKYAQDETLATSEVVKSHLSKKGITTFPIFKGKESRGEDTIGYIKNAISQGATNEEIESFYGLAKELMFTVIGIYAPSVKWSFEVEHFNRYYRKLRNDIHIYDLFRQYPHLNNSEDSKYEIFTKYDVFHTEDRTYEVAYRSATATVIREIYAEGEPMVHVLYKDGVEKEYLTLGDALASVKGKATVNVELLMDGDISTHKNLGLDEDGTFLPVEKGVDTYAVGAMYSILECNHLELQDLLHS